MYNYSQYSIDDLPEPVIKKIFSYFSTEEMITYILPVSEKWSIIGSDESLWTNLTFKGSKFSASSICSILSIASSLNSIKLDAVPQANIILSQLSSCNTMLKHLIVKNSSHINIDVLKALLRNCTDLQKINFKGTTFSSNGLYKRFICLVNLRSLAFSASEKYLNADMLIEILFNCGKIEHLSLHNYEPMKPVLTDDIMPLILERFKSTLKSLKLDCSRLEYRTFKVILKCWRLENLCLKNALTFSSTELKKIPVNLHLKKLKIEYSENLRNEDILDVFQAKYGRMEFIHSIGFPYLNHLEDSGMNAIVKICSDKLIQLNIEGCKHLSEETIMNVITKCSKLKHLNVAFVPSISKVSFCDSIPNNLKYLRIFIVDKNVSIEDLKKLNVKKPDLHIIISDNMFYKKHLNVFKRDSLLVF